MLRRSAAATLRVATLLRHVLRFCRHAGYCCHAYAVSLPVMLILLLSLLLRHFRQSVIGAAPPCLMLMTPLPMRLDYAILRLSA